jgi:hypothetical protein
MAAEGHLHRHISKGIEKQGEDGWKGVSVNRYHTYIHTQANTQTNEIGKYNFD